MQFAQARVGNGYCHTGIGHRHLSGISRLCLQTIVIPDNPEAIAMEKRIKRWRRAWKEMTYERNSGWIDLSEGRYHERDME